jgi:hypothetical protein
MMKKPRSQTGAFLFLRRPGIAAFAVIFAFLAVILAGGSASPAGLLLTNLPMLSFAPANCDSALTTIRITL